MRKIEKIFFILLLILTLFNILYFSLPLKAGGKLVCGVTYPPYPPDWHNFEYESNCCITIE